MKENGRENFIDKACIALYNSFCCVEVREMKWSLLELNKHREIPLEFSEELDVKQTLMARDNQLLDVSPAKVNGILSVEKKGYLLHYKLSVIVTIPSSRSLTPVAVPMELSVDEMFMTEEQFRGKDELISDEEIIVLDKPTIDLTESVEDNIYWQSHYKYYLRKNSRIVSYQKGLTGK